MALIRNGNPTMVGEAVQGVVRRVSDEQLEQLIRDPDFKDGMLVQQLCFDLREARQRLAAAEARLAAAEVKS